MQHNDYEICHPTDVDNSPALLASQVADRLRAAGFQSYFVGGCVRDLLLGRQPRDYDIATDAHPEQVLELYPTALRIGAHFGVVLVTSPYAQVEVATFRSDHNYQDGRRPENVHFETDPRQDAIRRDFTINALFLDPVDGDVIDFSEGRADLKAGLVRAIGNPEERFREDRLRMLRAIRFAARLNFSIEPSTEAAISGMRGAIQSVSAERVRDELIRILTEGGARRGFEMLDRTGLLVELLPEVAAMKGVEQPPEYHPEGDVWTHTLMMLEGLPTNPSPVLAWGVLLHDVGKPPTFRMADRIRFDGHVEAGVEIARAIMIRLRFSNSDMEQVEALIANHMKFKDLLSMRESTLKRFLRLPDFKEHLVLHRLDCLHSNGNLAAYEFAQAKLVQLGQERIAPARLLTGNDLIEAGFQPGPEFKRVLNLVEDAQLEGAIHTKAEALAFARSLPPQVSE